MLQRKYLWVSIFTVLLLIVSGALCLAEPLETWVGVCSHIPPERIQRLVYERGDEWAVHRIQDAYGSTMNLDYFAVRVKGMPKRKNKRISPSELLAYVRKNLNEFVDKDLCSFQPFTAEDEKVWTSDAPEGSILLLDIIVLGSPKVVDKACVVCSQASAANWMFSTVRAGTGYTALNNPSNPGAHPVSGNREFGYFEGSGGTVTIYTIGADRPTRAPDEFWGIPGINDTGLKMGDALWKSFQERLVAYIRENGGEAEPVIPKIERPQWSEVKDNPNVFSPKGKWYTRAELFPK